MNLMQYCLMRFGANMVNVSPVPPFWQLLAHELRWQLLSLLAESDRRVQELVERCQRPQNLISYHLRLLRDQGVVAERRSSADSRDVYYSLNLPRLQTLYLESGQALHPALVESSPTQTATVSESGEMPLRVLFLCTHNSARSQLAEAIMRDKGRGRVAVFSAGTEPSQVHPLAIRAAEAMNLDISQHRSKHVDEFAEQTFAYVITVCDRAREICPVFPGQPQQIHWSFPDPATVTGTETERFQAFLETARELSTRISYLWLMIEKGHR